MGLLMRNPFLIALTLIVAGCSGLSLRTPMRVADSDWLALGGNQARTYVSTFRLSPPLYERWRYEVNGGLGIEPLVADSTIFVVSNDGELQAFHIETGKRLGKTNLPSSVTAPPVLVGQNLICVTAAGKRNLISIRATDGKRNWELEWGEIESSPVVSGGTIYVVTADGTVAAFDASSGEQLWKLDPEVLPKSRPIRVRSTPALAGDILVYGDDSGRCYGVDVAAHVRKWRHHAEFGFFASPVIAGNLAIIGERNGTLYALRIADGAVVWQKNLGAMLYASVAFADSTVYVGGGDGTIRALSFADGSEIWSHSMRGLISAAPLIAGDYLVVGSNNENVYLLDRRTGEERWKHEVQGRIRVTPVIWGTYLVVLADSKIVYVFSEKGDDSE